MVVYSSIKTFFKSIKTPQPIFQSRIPFLILSVILIKGWDVDVIVWIQTVSYRKYYCYWEMYTIFYNYYNLILNVI